MSFVDYFSDIPSSHRFLLLAGGLTIFYFIENALPLFPSKETKWKNIGVNITFTLTTIVVNFAMAFILVGASTWVEFQEFGLLQWINLPLVAMAIIGVLLLDLMAAWLPHWVEHKVKWMWQFHLIHHTDQEVNTTTANRHHPGESVIRFVFTTIAVLIIGAPIWLVFLYQSLSVVLTQFNHSNVKINPQVDKVISYVFCTPNMHRIHHHYRQPYSDTNYGNIFSFWDRLFGTYILVDNAKLVYGVDTHMEVNDTTSLAKLLKMPFMKYRPPIVYKEEEKL